MLSLSTALALSVIAAGAVKVVSDAGDVSDTDGDAFGGAGELAGVTDTLSKVAGECAGVMAHDGKPGIDGRRIGIVWLPTSVQLTPSADRKP